MSSAHHHRFPFGTLLVFLLLAYLWASCGAQVSARTEYVMNGIGVVPSAVVGLLLLAAAASGLLLLSRLADWLGWPRPRTIPPHICRVCGYDIRASSERCPECGSAIQVTMNG